MITLTVDENRIRVKFERTPMTSTLVADRFQVRRQDDTFVTDPFLTINLATDYNSLARVLILKLNTALLDGTYDLVMTGVRDASNRLMQEQVDGVWGPIVRPFTVDADDSEEPPPPTPTPEPALNDHSIVPNAFAQFEITDGAIDPDAAFYVAQTDPIRGELFVTDTSHPRGMITVTFNRRPIAEHMTSEYFKVQRKMITTNASRWEKVPAQIVLDSYYPKVYIYLPSADEEATYAEEGRPYFEDGYKYRVKIVHGLAAA